MEMHRHPPKPRLARLALAAFAATLVLAACGSDDDSAADAPPPTETADDGPVTTPVPTEPTTPADAPPSSPPPTVPTDQRYEAIPTVIEDSSGLRLCFVVMESLPPQCGTGVELEGWSWDAIDVEQVQGDTTWVDQIYVSGTYDAAARTFTVAEARLATDADRERILLADPLPDDSLPCEAPDGGWPARDQEWPGTDIAAIEGYAGAWSDPSGQVMVVKFTDDLEAAEAAVREHYSDALCIVAASHSEAELAAIQEQLLSMSSVELLSTAIHVDGSGEWVEAETVVPDPARQAAFDDEFGPDVVRLTSRLRPVDTAAG